MKRYLLLIVFLFPYMAASQDLDAIIADSFSEAPPEWCTTGKSIEWSFGVGCDFEGNCSPDFSLDNLSFLKIEAKKYQLIGEETRVKGDGTYWVDRNRTVHFFDSLGGYRGHDKSGTAGNAYKNYQLTNSRGPIYSSGNMWVMAWSAAEGEYPGSYYLKSAFCSKKTVYWQNKPSLSGSLNNSKASLTYEVDSNSKAIREDIPATITVYARTQNGGSSEQVVGQAQVHQSHGSVDVSVSGYRVDQGKVYFTADIDDGTYSSNRIQIGTYTASCPTGFSWTFQTGPGSGTSPNYCGVDANGNGCPVSVRPVNSGSYPLLRYTCL